jgi:serine phosphatase RsbU (regulator of sigma subunit)
LSILTKYSLWLTGILLLAAGSITGSALWLQKQALTEQAILRGESIAVNLASAASDALLRKNDLLLITLSLNATRDHPHVVYAALLDAKGRVVGHADPKALRKPLAFKPALILEGAAEKAEVTQGSAMDQSVWDIAVPIVLRGTDKVLGSAHVGIARAGVIRSIWASLGQLALVSLLLLLLGAGLTYGAVLVVVKPLRELAAASAVVGTGDLSASVPVRSDDEIGLLAANFNAMVAGLKVAEEAKFRQQRIESELELARGIQAGLLPAAPPKVAGLESAFSCTPAKELGGDFYDCFEILGGQAWGFLIADVSGKGVPAALHMANLHNVFRMLGVDNLSPSDTLKKVNSLAYADLQGEAFITLIYAVVELPGRRVRLVNAGHDPAYWVRPGGEITAYDSTAMPVGLVKGREYDAEVSEVEFQLGAGDLLFTFTDGVTEAMDANSAQYGLDRLKAAVTAPGSAAERIGRLAAEVQAHAAGVEQSDDITMLAVRAV